MNWKSKRACLVLLALAVFSAMAASPRAYSGDETTREEEKGKGDKKKGGCCG